MYASDASLPLPDICIRALEHRRQVEARYRSVAPAWHESGLVLTTRLGTPIDPRNFHRAFVDRAKRAGVPVTPVHLTARRVRRCWSRWMCIRGWPCRSSGTARSR
jgi:integrase